jgi:two-component system phosphate regulon sensor histidine kinase PhoR
MRSYSQLLTACLIGAAVVAGFASIFLPGSGLSPARTAIVVLLFAAVFAVPAVGAAIWLARERRSLLSTADDLNAALTQQRAAFEEHRAAVDQLVGALREGLLAVSRNGRVVFANSRIADMFGTRGTLEGRTVLEVVRKEKVADAISAALAGKVSAERLVLTNAAGDRQIEMRVFPVTGSGSIAAVALFVDITDLARLQRIRRDFLDDFSHEVRTPLAGLRSAAETLDAGGLTTDHEQALRQVMFRQLNRIERLVKDLAELNRIESGEMILERRKVDLNRVLNDLCDDFRERLSGQDVTFNVTGESATASADPVRLQQIFSNLLDNAWKHGGGGEITVEVARDNGQAVVRVSDQGDGIAAAETERIFNRFYRVDRSRSQSVPGVGLGLAITKHLVLLHGGSIRAFNRPEGGATFEVRLPAA